KSLDTDIWGIIRNLRSEMVSANINPDKRRTTHESRPLALCAHCNAQEFTSFEEAHARSPGSGAPADDGGHILHTITPRNDREGELHDISEGPNLPFVGMAREHQFDAGTGRSLGFQRGVREQDAGTLGPLTQHLLHDFRMCCASPKCHVI